jgi:hypothetical protein
VEIQRNLGAGSSYFDKAVVGSEGARRDVVRFFAPNWYCLGPLLICKTFLWLQTQIKLIKILKFDQNLNEVKKNQIKAF